MAKIKGKNEIRSIRKVPCKYLSDILPMSLMGRSFSSDLNSIKKVKIISMRKQNSLRMSDQMQMHSFKFSHPCVLSMWYCAGKPKAAQKPLASTEYRLKSAMKIYQALRKVLSSLIINESTKLLFFFQDSFSSWFPRDSCSSINF